MIGIIGAMSVEVNSIVASLENAEKIEKGGRTYNKGKLFGKDVVVVQCGVGKVNAALCAQSIISEFGADRVINTGIAGAMGAGLEVFDFVVSTGAVHHDVDVRVFGYELGHVPTIDVKIFPADKTMADTAMKAFASSEISKEHKVISGLVASGDQFISEKPQKDFIKTNFNPACCEMEGASIAQTCYLNKVPFLILRCMSDMADESTPTYQFNEESAAELSGKFLMEVIKGI